MNEKRPSFQFYPKDLLSDTEAMAMPNEAMGIYFKLLCYDWVNDGLPNDDKILMKIAGFEWTDLSGNIRDGEDFDVIMRHIHGRLMAHPSRAKFLTNSRLQKEREKQDDFAQKKIEAGKKGAKNRWCKPKNGALANNGTPIVLPMANDGSSSPSSTSVDTPLPPKGDVEGRKKQKGDGALDLRPIAEKTLVKWLSGMQDVTSPTKLAKTYLTQHRSAAIIKALKNSACTSRAEFSRLLDFYKKN